MEKDAGNNRRVSIPVPLEGGQREFKPERRSIKNRRDHCIEIEPIQIIRTYAGVHPKVFRSLQRSPFRSQRVDEAPCHDDRKSASTRRCPASEQELISEVEDFSGKEARSFLLKRVNRFL